MREVERLYRLQELDNGLAMGERKLQELAEHLQRLEHAIEQVRDARAAGEEDLGSQEKHLRHAEGSLWEQETRLKEMEGRLYGGAIRSEKEAQALRAQIEQGSERKEELEDEVLQRMIDLDGLRGRLEELSAEEERRLGEYQAAAQEAAAQESALRQQLAPLQASREALAAEVSPGTLALYEQLRREHSGLAVAPVEDNRCAGCRLEVALLTRKAVLGEKVVRCEYCGRILFIA